MKKTKKIFSLILALVLCVNLGIGAFSSSGGSSASVTCKVDGSTLFFSGSGAVSLTNDYASLSTSVETVVFGEGITTISNGAFQNFAQLTTVYLPASLQTIGGGAFLGCDKLSTVHYAGADTSGVSSNSTSMRIAKDNWITGSSYPYEDDSGSGGDTTDTPESVALSFSITSADAVVGDEAVVELKITEGCSRIGATLDVSAIGEDGAALPLSGIELLCAGCTNENNSGRFVLAYTGALAAGATIARFTFNTAGAAVGDYTVSVAGDIYTGSDNTPVEETIGSGTITVKEPTVTVTWLGANNEVLQSGSVNRGDTPEYTGATPTKAPDKLYEYEFDGWDKEIVAADEDATYTAQFKSAAREYTVNLDCDIPGVEYTLTENGGSEVKANSNGSFTVDTTKTYTVTVSAVGYESASVEFSISGNTDGLTVDESTGTATLSIAAPEKRMGDVDNDGLVDMQDAQTLFSYLAGNLGSLPADGIIRGSDGSIIFNSNVADISGENGISADDILPMLDKIAATGN